MPVFLKVIIIMDYQVYEPADFIVRSGLTLRDARLVYKTYGVLNEDKSNVILYPTRFGGTHVDNEYLIGEGMALDPAKYFIVVPNLLGNGLSSSPSNASIPFDRSRFPQMTVHDNVLLQEKLLREVFGIEDIALVVGWSMAAQQAYHWAALFPDRVKRLAPIAGSARTSPHNYVFLEGVKTALITDPEWRGGWYDQPPQAGLRAMGRVWAGWALSHDFYRKHMYLDLGYSSLEDYLVAYWEAVYLKRDANDILAMIWTWQHADLSDNDIFNGDYEAALGAITAKTIVMPGRTDMYFPPKDSAIEVGLMPNAELRVIPSIWGHYAGGPASADDVSFVDAALKELLSSNDLMTERSDYWRASNN